MNKQTFARATGVVAALAASMAHAQYSRTEVLTYHDNLASWVVGQPAKTTSTGPSGTFEVSRTDYNAATALPERTYAFGKRLQTMAYRADGTLLSVTDGRDIPINFGVWKRGIPTSIAFADGTSIAADIDGYGLIKSVTNEIGAKTCYVYDAMGRLSYISHPSETQPGVCDTSAWIGTSIVFNNATTAAYGMPAGHWRQTTHTGNRRKILIFDALWRPVVEQHLELGNVPDTTQEIFRRYDHEGRLVFESYTMDSAGLAIYNDTTLKGVHTTYDALGRPTYVKQDSELPFAVGTTTEYLDGFLTKVTNPGGKATTTSYYTWDAPTTDFPKDIDHPGDVITNIARDDFGKPLTITRRNAASSYWQRRYWAYNAHQELCKRMEVESGTTLMDYDAAGNLAWSASGLSWSDPTRCDDLAAPASAVIERTYDQRNRLQTITFGDGNGNTTYGYDPDGQLTSLATTNIDATGTPSVATSTYGYNKRRLLTSERLQWGPVNWPVAYAYDSYGNLASQAWHGLTVDYAPNAMGQPTKAGVFASNVKYHPNGAMASFTYGNGIAHTLTQNTRGLPSLSQDRYATTDYLKDAYTYDANGNVAAISDGLSGAAGNRTMTYDDLDRLASVNSPLYSGTIAYTYDSADKIRTVTKPGGVHLRYCYHPTNDVGLQFIRTGSTNCSDGAATTSFTFTTQGNLQSKNNVDYTFDIDNRLRNTQVAGAVTSQYAYDGHGRRVWDYTTDDKYSHYSLDGRLLMTADERGSGKVAEYIQLNGSLVALQERDVATGVYTTKYQHTDALGSPVVVTNQSRAVLERVAHEPYGKQVSGPLSDGPGYTGHVEDVATGLMYMQQRYYDPDVARFLSVDPVTTDGAGGNFNRYWYANNNSFRFTDPDGREAGGGYATGQYTTVAPDDPEAAITIASVAYGGGLVVAGLRGLPAGVRALGSVLRRSEPKDLPKNPNDLTKTGYRETSHPKAAEKGHRTFENPTTGDKLRHDQGKPGKPGHEGRDHYHRENPNATGKQDQYLDNNGNPVSRGSDASHLYPKERT